MTNYSKSKPSTKYTLSFRKNLGVSAAYKNGQDLTHLKDSNDYMYLKNWIFENGDTKMVYFIQGIETKCVDKFVYNDKKQWHKTSFRTSKDPSLPPWTCCGVEPMKRLK